MKEFFISASSNPKCADFYERIKVVNLRLNKHHGPLEHEYVIIETEDRDDGAGRYFCIDRQLKVRDPPPDGPEEHDTEKNPKARGHKLLNNLFRTPSASTLSSMEEGTSLSPPISFPSHQQSIADEMTLCSTKIAHTVAKAKKKGSKLDSSDRILGHEWVFNSGYLNGQNGRQIAPINMSLFDLVVLAQVVHEFAPEYSTLEHNCYWYCNIIVDACIELFELEAIGPITKDSETRVKFGPHDTAVSGRMKGIKVSHTNPADLAIVVRDFKKARSKALQRVKFFFLNYHSC